MTVSGLNGICPAYAAMNTIMPNLLKAKGTEDTIVPGKQPARKPAQVAAR